MSIMKNKKCFMIGFLMISVFLGIAIKTNYVKAYIGTYEKRTDPSNPFIFMTDIVYVPIDHELNFHEIETLYHQVVLQINNYYLFYLSCSLGGISKLYFNLATDQFIDNYNEDFEYISDGMIYLVLFNVSQTGLYNLTLEFGTIGFDTYIGFYGIGFLELPNMNLNEEFAMNYWDFYSNYITTGKLHLENDYYTVATNDGIMQYYPSATVYYKNLGSAFQFEKLSEWAYLQIDCSQDYKTYLISGDYCFFSLDGDEFGLIQTSSPSGTTQIIPGYSLFILGLTSLMTMLLLIKKFKKELNT